MTILPPTVIPAEAGTQTRLSDVRGAGLDSRLRGNDVVGGEALALVLAIREDVDALKNDMLDFGVALEASRQQVSHLRRLSERMYAETRAASASLDRIERRLDIIEAAK